MGRYDEISRRVNEGSAQFGAASGCTDVVHYSIEELNIAPEPFTQKVWTMLKKMLIDLSIPTECKLTIQHLPFWLTQVNSNTDLFFKKRVIYNILLRLFGNIDTPMYMMFDNDALHISLLRHNESLISRLSNKNGQVLFDEFGCWIASSLNGAMFLRNYLIFEAGRFASIGLQANFLQLERKIRHMPQGNMDLRLLGSPLPHEPFIGLLCSGDLVMLNPPMSMSRPLQGELPQAGQAASSSNSDKLADLRDIDMQIFMQKNNLQLGTDIKYLSFGDLYDLTHDESKATYIHMFTIPLSRKEVQALFVGQIPMALFENSRERNDCIEVNASRLILGLFVNMMQEIGCDSASQEPLKISFKINKNSGQGKSRVLLLSITNRELNITALRNLADNLTERVWFSSTGVYYSLNQGATLALRSHVANIREKHYSPLVGSNFLGYPSSLMTVQVSLHTLKNILRDSLQDQEETHQELHLSRAAGGFNATMFAAAARSSAPTDETTDDDSLERSLVENLGI